MYILHQNRRNYRTSLWECECVNQFLNETISWFIQHGKHITLNEKSFIFDIDPDQNSDINKLVLMKVQYYIYTERNF